MVEGTGRRGRDRKVPEKPKVYTGREAKVLSSGLRGNTVAGRQVGGLIPGP